MAQTTTMSKLRGRHYAARAARATAGASASTTNDVSNNNIINNSNSNNSIRHSHRYINNTTRNSTDYNNTPSDSVANTNRNNISSNNNTSNNDTTSIINDGSDDAGDRIDREMQLVQGISDRLETGLNEFALRAILDLLKRGEQPDAIVAVVTSLAQRPTTTR